MPTSRPPSRVWLVAGKPPRPGTLVAEVADHLRAAGVAVEVRLPHDDPGALHGEPPDLVVHRGLAAPAREAVRALGVPACPDPSAVAVVDDRTRLLEVLRDAGVPVPAGTTTTRWSDVQEAVARAPRVVKAAADATGRAARVVVLRPADGPAPPPFPGPWLVQDLVAGDGVDRKLYVVGAHVRGLLKPTPLDAVAPGPAPARPAPARPAALTRPAPTRPAPEPFDPDAGLVALARRVGEVLDLHLYGVDVLLGPTGPVVVDVNAVPGFRGVTGAPALVTEHLLTAHLGR